MKVTAVTEVPAYHDLHGSLDRARDIVTRAAREGSSLVVFSEAWIPGYVDFAWSLPPDNSVHSEVSRAFERLWTNAVDLSTDALAPLFETIREAGVVVVLGVQERSGGTLYNTGLIIDADGTVLNVHRKLMPTNVERTAWGFGDGAGLRVVDTAAGRIGMLLCWENYMPLARTALYAQSPEIWCAPTADPSPVWHATMQHIGMESGCAVIGVCQAMRVADLPADLPGRDRIAEGGEWVRKGNTSIIAPGGAVLARPEPEFIGLTHADIDLSDVPKARRSFDPVGHYSRPDVFELSVNRSARKPVGFGGRPGDG